MNALARDITMDQEAFRHVPYDIEVEQALLGALLTDISNYFRLSEVSTLTADEFYDAFHGRLFDCIAAHAQKGERVSPLTIHASMKADPGLQEIGGHGYLAGLSQAAPAVPNLNDLAKIIRELSQRRELIRIGEDLVNGAYEAPDDSPASKIADEATAALYSIAIGDDDRRAPILAGSAAQFLMRNIEHGVSPAVCNTGIQAIDDVLGGLHAGDVIIVAGRPGMGKSIASINLGVNIAKSGIPAELYTLEMSTEQNAARCLANMLFDMPERTIPNWVSYGRILKAQISRDEQSAAATAANYLAAIPLTIHDSAGLTVRQIASRARARAAKLGSKKGVILIDHLHKIFPSGQFRGNMVLELGDMTKQLEVLGKELGWPVIVFAQINRGVENREVKDKRPTISDLRQSGAIEEDAAVVAMLYRPAYYALKKRPEKGEQDPGYVSWLADYEACKHDLEFIIDKNRHGRTGTVKVFIEPGASAIRDEQSYTCGPESNPGWWEGRE